MWPVAKNAEAVLSPTAELADRCTMADAGTLVTADTGRGLVVATGPAPALGRIAGLVEFFESDRFAGAGDEDVDPAAMSVGAAIGTDIPDLYDVEGVGDQHRIGQQTQTTRPVHDLIIIT